MLVNANAMQAFAWGVNTTAHNIANVNTNDFNRLNHTYSNRTGQSVEINVEKSNQNFGPDRVTLSTQAGQAADQNVNQVAEMPERINNNVDLGREMTSLMIDQRAFEAQAVPIRTQDEMNKTIIDLIA